MVREFKIYKERKTGLRSMDIYDLSFISDRNHKLGWFGLHLRHFTIKVFLKCADRVRVPDYKVAIDLIKYYFYPKDRITVDRTILPADKA